MIQADPNKYYHVFTPGFFPYLDWEKGEWAKFEIKPEYAEAVAKCYDASVHKAPVWIGHPSSGAEALAWIAGVKFEDGKLFNSFEYIDEELIAAIRNKRFQYVSVEFGKVMNIDHDYQIALGITNLPRVSGQKPLDIENYQQKPGGIVCTPLTKAFSIDLVKEYSGDENKKHFFQNQNTKPMNEFLTKLAALFSIDVSQCSNDEAAYQKISDSFSQVRDAKTKLEKENKELVDQRVKFTLDLAIESGRMQPNERETYESLLRGNFEAAAKVLLGRPVDPALSKNSIPSGGEKSEVKDPSAPAGEPDKFTNADGTKMNYQQFMEKVEDDPSFASKFSDEEIFAIPGAERYLIKG